MPYSDSNSFELASYRPLQRLLDSDKVRALEGRMRVRKQPLDRSENLDIIRREKLEPSNWQPEMVLAIDGSMHAVPVENGFPHAEYGYVTVASVLILLDKVRELERAEFIDPAQFRETEKAAATESAYPGTNVIVDKDSSPRSSFRRILFEELRVEAPFYDAGEPQRETLFETYEYLLRLQRKNRPSVRAAECPLEDCDQSMKEGYGEYSCSCPRNATLFSSDSLRLHELQSSTGSSGELYGQVMYTLERLWLIHILRGFERLSLFKSLKNLAFVVDGPLGIFSTPAWLTKPIKDELRRLNNAQREVNGQDLIILGIEKSGQFVNHFEFLDTDPEGTRGVLPNQSAILLTDSYIKENIRLSDSPKPYGQDTYFGRKFFYKTNNGYRVTANVAVFDNYQENIATAHPNQFPRLADVMSLLDQIVSSRFQNSVSPLISAHAEASIPLNLGKRLFEDIAREIRNRS